MEPLTHFQTGCALKGHSHNNGPSCWSFSECKHIWPCIPVCLPKAVRWWQRKLHLWIHNLMNFQLLLKTGCSCKYRKAWFLLQGLTHLLWAFSSEMNLFFKCCIELPSSWEDGNVALKGKHCPGAVVRISEDLILILSLVWCGVFVNHQSFKLRVLIGFSYKMRWMHNKVLWNFVSESELSDWGYFVINVFFTSLG